MVILDVGLLSGFSLSPGAAALTGLIRKVEILPEKVSLYLDSVSVSACLHFMVRHDTSSEDGHFRFILSNQNLKKIVRVKVTLCNNCTLK